jgi:hypothetical protein
LSLIYFASILTLAHLKKTADVIAAFHDSFNFFSVPNFQNAIKVDDDILEFQVNQLTLYLMPQKLMKMSRYYSQEMGKAEEFVRYFLFCPVKVFSLNENIYQEKKSTLLKSGYLVTLKNMGLAIENDYFYLEKGNMSFPKNRTINWDPGLMNDSQVWLTSTKPYSHRLWLQHNVYAELVYTRFHLKWQSTPWAYQDYAHHLMRDMFMSRLQVYK